MKQMDGNKKRWRERSALFFQRRMNIDIKAKQWVEQPPLQPSSAPVYPKKIYDMNTC
jgi:hypothetical protein